MLRIDLLAGGRHGRYSKIGILTGGRDKHGTPSDLEIGGVGWYAMPCVCEMRDS